MGAARAYAMADTALAQTRIEELSAGDLVVLRRGHPRDPLLAGRVVRKDRQSIVSRHTWEGGAVRVTRDAWGVAKGKRDVQEFG